jgi:hypothetical protein
VPDKAPVAFPASALLETPVSELVDAGQLADYLKIKRNAVLNLTRATGRNKNPLPVIRVTSKIVRFDLAAVRLWLASKTDVRPNPKPRPYKRRKKIATA